MADTLNLEYLNTLCFTDELSTATSTDPPKDALQALCDLVGISSEASKKDDVCTPKKMPKSEPSFASCCYYTPESTNSYNEQKIPTFENKVCIKSVDVIKRHRSLFSDISYAKILHKNNIY